MKAQDIFHAVVLGVIAIIAIAVCTRLAAFIMPPKHGSKVTQEYKCKWQRDSEGDIFPTISKGGEE